MKSIQALDALHALAQESRLAVFRLLVKAGPDGMAAGAIAKAVGAPASTMSAHLSILSNAGLIAARRESRTIYYSLDIDAVRGLFDFLAADCCGGRPELCAPLTGMLASATCGPIKSKRAKKRA
jgi:DNA-binding transcriptional ArsR family regulator